MPLPSTKRKRSSYRSLKRFHEVYLTKKGLGARKEYLPEVAGEETESSASSF